jgi:hypothetical protein
VCFTFVFLYRLPHSLEAALTGRLDVPWLLAEMRRCGRGPSIIVEQWPPFSDTIGDTVALEAAWAEQSVRYLETCIRD